MGDRGTARRLPPQDNTNTKGSHISLPQVGFEPTIPVYEGKGIVYVVYHRGAAIGCRHCSTANIEQKNSPS